MYTCMYNGVTILYSRKLTEHSKPAIMEKIEIIIKKKKKKDSVAGQDSHGSHSRHSPLWEERVE